VFPILYAVIDGLGTFLDAVYLDELSLIGEDAALIAYEYTFLLVGAGCWLFLRRKRVPFHVTREKDKGIAALFETAGQFFYVFAMARNAVIAAPMIASYSIVSILLSRLFLKEKLSRAHYAAIGIVMLGIAVLGLADAG
jgi:drug/metabolite transporter (DMT)-like permease